MRRSIERGRIVDARIAEDTILLMRSVGATENVQSRVLISHSSAEWSDARARTVLRRLFDTAVASADPRIAVTRHLPPKPKGRCVVVGAGKAAAAMAAGIDAAWPDVDLSGVVVTSYGNATPAGRIDVIEAAHPVPDARSPQAARRILEAVGGLTTDDLVIALLSPAGSGLMALPADGMTLEDKRAVVRALLVSGAPVSEISVVTKHLSAIKGGRLAAAARPAGVVTIVISNIPGDYPEAVALGPTSPDLSTRADALAIAARWSLKLPPAARAVLELGEETPKPAEIAADVRLAAAPSLALEETAKFVRSEGLTPLILGGEIEGEAREFGTVMAAIARSAAKHGYPVAAPAVLLSGGETTVTVRSGGRGGPNTEFLLALAVALDGASRIWAIAGNTTGVDGSADAAGAIVTPDTLDRARHLGLDAHKFLWNNDSYTYFEGLGDLVRMGPTMTDVNDIRAVLVGHIGEQAETKTKANALHRPTRINE